MFIENKAKKKTYFRKINWNNKNVGSGKDVISYSSFLRLMY